MEAERPPDDAGVAHGAAAELVPCAAEEGLCAAAWRPAPLFAITPLEQGRTDACDFWAC